MIRGAARGELFVKSTFDTFEVNAGNKTALEACRLLSAGEIKGVILIGLVGRGKTHLLESLAKEFDRIHSYIPVAEEFGDVVEIPPLRELIDAQFGDEVDISAPYLRKDEISKHAHVEFWPMLDLAAALRRDAVGGDGEIVERCMRCDLLLLDDLGREKASDFIMQEFDRIVDYRYRQMLPIAVSTNLTWAGIVDMYSGHTASRWAHSCEVVEVTGPDYRLQGGRK